MPHKQPSHPNPKSIEMTDTAAGDQPQFAMVCGRRVVSVPKNHVFADGRRVVVVVDHSGSMRTGQRVVQARMCMQTVRDACVCQGSELRILSFGDGVVQVKVDELDRWTSMGSGTQLQALAEAMLIGISPSGVKEEKGGRDAPSPQVAPKTTFVVITDSEQVSDHAYAASRLALTAFPGSRFLFIGVGDSHEMSDLVCLIKPEYGLQSFYLHVPEKQPVAVLKVQTLFGARTSTAASTDVLQPKDAGVDVDDILAVLHSSEVVIDGVTSVYVKAGDTYVVPDAAGTVHFNGVDVTHRFTDTLALTPELVDSLGTDMVATWMRLYYAALAPKKHTKLSVVPKETTDAILSAVRSLASDDVVFVDKLLRALKRPDKLGLQEAMARVGAGQKLTPEDRAAIRATVYTMEKSRQDLLSMCRDIKTIINGAPSEETLEMARSIWENTSRGGSTRSQASIDRLLTRAAQKQDTELLTRTLASLEDPDFKPELNAVADSLDAYGLTHFPELADGCVITGEQGTVLVFMGVGVCGRGLGATENPLIVRASAVDASPISLAAALASLRATGSTRMTVDDINGIVGLLPGAAWRAAIGYPLFVSHLATGDVTTAIHGLRAVLTPLIGVETALSQNLTEKATMMALGWAALAARTKVRPLDAKGLVLKDATPTCALDVAFDLLEAALGDDGQFLASRAIMRPGLWAALAFALGTVQATPIPEVAKYAGRVVTSPELNTRLYCVELANQALYARAAVPDAPVVANPWKYVGVPCATPDSGASAGVVVSDSPEETDETSTGYWKSLLTGMPAHNLNALFLNRVGEADAGVDYSRANDAEDKFLSRVVKRCGTLLAVLGLPAKTCATLADRAVVWDAVQRGGWDAEQFAVFAVPGVWVRGTSARMANALGRVIDDARQGVMSACNFAFKRLQNSNMPVMLPVENSVRLLSGLTEEFREDVMARVPEKGAHPGLRTGMLKNLSCRLDSEDFLSSSYLKGGSAFGPSGTDMYFARFHATARGQYQSKLYGPGDEQVFVDDLLKVAPTHWPRCNMAELEQFIRDFWFNMQLIEGRAVDVGPEVLSRPQPECPEDAPFWSNPAALPKWTYRKAVAETVAFFKGLPTTAAEPGPVINVRPLLRQLWLHRTNIIPFATYHSKVVQYATEMGWGQFVPKFDADIRKHFADAMTNERVAKECAAGLRAVA